MKHLSGRLNRRALVRSIVAAGGLSLTKTSIQSREAATTMKIRTRPIPSTGEALPVVGLGTWQVFDVGTTEAELEPRREILTMMHENGATMIDSSPMYRRSENIVGVTLDGLELTDSMFLATKVWTKGRSAGLKQMQSSFELFRSDVIDLMQVHNLVDLDTQLESIRELQAEKRIRYSGITHYRVDAFEELAKAMTTKAVDFVQLNYSIATRAAEKRLLPLAAEKGIAVIVNRPFETGGMFSKVKGKALPEWSADLDIHSWGQFFLKYILSQAAVTVVIPGTAKPKHMLDNLGAGLGRLPNRDERQRMVRYFENL